jgi:hypothetical protein
MYMSIDPGVQIFSWAAPIKLHAMPNPRMSLIQERFFSICLLTVLQFSQTRYQVLKILTVIYQSSPRNVVHNTLLL